MTLNITIFSQDRIFQSSDFRLTDLRSGRQLDVVAHKQFVVTAFDFQAVVAFTGIAHTGRLDVLEWMRSRLTLFSSDKSYEDLITCLNAADDWLSYVPLTVRWHTFIVGSFVGSTPRLTLLSTFESLDKSPSNLPSLRLMRSEVRPRKPGAVVTGLAQVVTGQERELLRRLASRQGREPAEAQRVMARINAAAASRHRGISTGCYTAYLSRSGTGSTMPHGIDPTKDFLPPGMLEATGLKLRRSHDPEGRPRPLQMRGTSFARSPRDEDEHRFRIREQPRSPEALTNFGAYLAGRPGRTEEAKALYRRALAVDPSFTNAQGNLAGLLWQDRELDEAERFYRAVARADNPSSIHLASYAQLLWLERRNLAQAQRHFERAVDAQPADGESRSKYLLFLAESGQLEHAGHQFQILMGDPSSLNANTLTRVGQYLERFCDDYDHAADLYTNAVEREDGNVFARVEYGRFLITVRRSIVAAADQYERALASNPTDPELQAAVAAILTLLAKSPDKAERLFREALAAGADPSARVNFAQHLILQDRDDEAIEELRELASISLPQDAHAEVLFYCYAHYSEHFPEALNNLRMQADLEGASPTWNFDRNLERIRREDGTTSDFVVALADVITGTRPLQILGQYNEWAGRRDTGPLGRASQSKTGQHRPPGNGPGGRPREVVGGVDGLRRSSSQLTRLAQSTTRPISS